MPIVTLACAYDNHAGGRRVPGSSGPVQLKGCSSKLCECECHTPKSQKAISVAREAAHQAVKGFDIKPDLAHTTAAIEALSEYEQLLKEAEDDGR